MQALQSSRQGLARWQIPALIPVVVSLSGCAAVKGIFKAGVWVGVLAVVMVLGGAFLLTRLFKG